MNVTQHFEQLIKIVGEGNVFIDGDIIESHSKDETEDLVFKPDVVARPENAQIVADLLKYCNNNNLKVTPRGAGTGLSGGALAVNGGVVLDTSRLNKIIEIDTRNLQATVQPGVITQVFQEAVKEYGLFYPPDPSSRGSCFLGGNLSESAGGPKAVKYGTTKDYVLNIQIALMNGELIWTGANVLKNATGYNLTQLIIGSEGTLGVITAIVFRLIPHPKKDLLLMASFKDIEGACSAVSDVFRHGYIPSAMEFMEKDAIVWAKKYTNSTFDLEDGTEAYLLIEVDGNDESVLFSDCEGITAVLEKYGCKNILFADTATQKNDLWSLRRNVAEAVKSNSVYKEEDAVVPRAELPKLLAGVKEIGNRFGFKSVCYGHAGDGNLHINIVKGDLSDDFWNNGLIDGIKELFTLIKELKGTISGEHGIGLVQKEFMPIFFSQQHLHLFKEIKKVFDPKGILNPGKIWT
jgi:glycolate oxidase